MKWFANSPNIVSSNDIICFALKRIFGVKLTRKRVHNAEAR